MKIFLLITVFLQLVSCGFLKKNEVDISGTYISEWTSEFAEVRDTIQVRFIQPGACSITRRTFIMKNHKPDYKLIHWTGTYNGDDKSLVVRGNGRILWFKEDEMRMGTTIYKKL